MADFCSQDEFSLITDSRYDKIGVQNVFIVDSKLDDLITEIALSWDNLFYLFRGYPKNEETKKSAVTRFLPSRKPFNIHEFVADEIKKNRNYYSFLGEYLLILAMRDVMGFHLVHALIDINGTPSDTSSGVDACLYDPEKETFVLGEAKFYVSLDDAVGQIHEDFTTSKGLSNKVDRLYRIAKIQGGKLLLQILGEKDCSEISFSQFLSTDIYFAGFMVQSDSPATTGEELYDKAGFDAGEITKSLRDTFELPFFPPCRLVLFHLPIHSKEELIAKVITKAYELQESLR